MKVWIGTPKEFSKNRFLIVDENDLFEIEDTEVSILKLPNPNRDYPPPVEHVLGVTVIEEEQDALVVTG